MADIKYKLEERRQQMYIRTYAVLCLLFVTLMGFYTYSKWDQYQLAIQGVAQNKSYISSLRNSVSSEKAVAETKMADAVKLNKDVGEKLKVIFPTGDDYTNLTKRIDAYEGDLSKKTSPFEVSNIDYQEPIINENYSVLPMRMNIRSSKENFTNFLHMVENSGSLKNNIRLMDISSIRLNFENNAQDANASEIISFSVQTLISKNK
jgi:membrane-associated HD superfamily phosphohydrolase